jgi:polysaccharide biosynthesis transport protein
VVDQQLNAANASAGVNIGLADVLRGMLRRVPLILACLVLGAIIGTLINTFVKPRYVAEATLIIEQPLNPTQPVATGQNTTQQNLPRPEPVTDRDVAAQISILSSTETANLVVKQLNLATRKDFAEASEPSAFRQFLTDWGFREDMGRLPPDRRARETLEADVSIYQYPGSNLIGIKYTAGEPQLAADIANNWAKAFILSSEEKQLGSAGRNREWLARQIEDLRLKVSDSEREAESFRAKSGLIKGERDTLGTQEISELNTQITLANSQRSEADAKLKEIKSILARKGAVESSSDVINSPTVQQLSEKLVAARSKLTEFSATYLEKHPKIIAARKDVSDLERQIRREALKVVDSLEGQAKVAGSRVATLENRLAELKKTAATENLDEVRLRELERSAAANRTLLEGLLSRYAEANAVRTVPPAVGVARLIQEAVVPNQVSFPKRGPVLLLASTAGLALGLGLAFLLSLLSATARPNYAPQYSAPQYSVPQYNAQIAQSQTPNLAQAPSFQPLPIEPSFVPQGSPVAVQQTVHVAHGANPPRVPSLFEQQDDVAIVAAPEPVKTEAFANAPVAAVPVTQVPMPAEKQVDVVSYIVETIESEIAQGTRPRISFSRIAGEALDGAGAALAAARAIAAKGRKVLVIDVDSESLGVQTILGLSNAVGVSDAALNKVSFTRTITRDPDSKVHIMRYGLSASDEGVRAIAEKLPAMLRGLDSIYDTVILHAGQARPAIFGSLLHFPIAFILAPATRKQDVSLAADTLVENGVVDAHFIQLAQTTPVA